MSDSPNMFRDMMAAEWFVDKVRASEAYAQNLYAAMCNNDFQKMEPWALLKDEGWGVSWRGAGGVVADLRGTGDYMDYYCSGIFNEGSYIPGHVEEGMVTEEIEEDLKKLGWQVLGDKNTNF